MGNSPQQQAPSSFGSPSPMPGVSTPLSGTGTGTGMPGFVGNVGNIMAGGSSNITDLIRNVNQMRGTGGGGTAPIGVNSVGGMGARSKA